MEMCPFDSSLLDGKGKECISQIQTGLVVTMRCLFWYRFQFENGYTIFKVCPFTGYCMTPLCSTSFAVILIPVHLKPV